MQKLKDFSELQEFAAQQKQTTTNNILDSLSIDLKDKILKKSKLTVTEQIEYMKAKGISFTLHNETQTEIYLSQHSYYYKVTAYRKNFLKDSQGLYKNLDFAHLKDLAIIDMHLRYLVIKLALDIEHALKSLIISLITDDTGEDGFKIIDDYNHYEQNNFEKSIDKNTNILPADKDKEKAKYISVKDKILKDIKNKRDYNYDLYAKNKNRLSVWILIEMMSYGQLSSFIKFYVETNRHKSTQLKKAAQFLHFSKNVRDSAAHSRPILLNVTEENQLGGYNEDKKAKLQLKDYLIQCGVHKRVAARLLTNFKIHDLCTLLFLHENYIKGALARKSRKKEMMYLYKRALYKRHIYSSNLTFKEITNLFYCLIKKYRLNC